MAGQFADEVAATMCTRCDPGKYKPNGTAPHECVSCERGLASAAKSHAYQEQMLCCRPQLLDRPPIDPIRQL
eukprot:3309164-Amphidinium_carterae.1